jgi:hypothetical protein
MQQQPRKHMVNPVTIQVNFITLIFSWGGLRLSSLGTSAIIGLLNQP